MMITIVPCTSENAATIAQLWNAKRLDAASCWHGAEPVDAAYVAQLLAGGVSMSLAQADGSSAGFGMWCGTGNVLRLVAIAADDDEVYYRLMHAFALWGQAAGGEVGFAELGVQATSERSRMDAVGVISYTPIGFEPLMPGQQPATRVPQRLRAECDLETLEQAVAQILEAVT